MSSKVEPERLSFVAIYGLRWRDLWNVVFALPVSIGLALDLLGRSGFSGPLATFLWNWRLDCRRFLDWINQFTGGGLTLSDREKDALTLALLSAVAICASLIFHAGQSFGSLVLAARQGRSEFSRRFASAILIWTTVIVAYYFVLNPSWWLYVVAAAATVLISVVPMTRKRKRTPEEKRALEIMWHRLQTDEASRREFEAHSRYLDMLPYAAAFAGTVLLALILSLAARPSQSSLPIMLLCTGTTVALSYLNWRAFPAIFLNAIVIVAFDELTRVLQPIAQYLQRLLS